MRYKFFALLLVLMLIPVAGFAAEDKKEPAATDVKKEESGKKTTNKPGTRDLIFEDDGAGKEEAKKESSTTPQKSANKPGTRDLIFEEDGAEKKKDASDTSNKAGTRDLVFDEKELEKNREKAETPEKDPEIKDGTKISISMTMELTRDGKTEMVPSNTVFRTGDRVRIKYTPSIDGYAYWVAKMASGKFTVIYPTPQAGMENAIKKGQEYTVPPKGAFRFDENTGKEILMCILSPTKLTDLDEAIAEAAEAGKDVDLATKKIAALEEENLNKRKTRDLVFEEDENDKASVKTQTAKPGEPFVATYELTNEKAMDDEAEEKKE